MPSTRTMTHLVLASSRGGWPQQLSFAKGSGVTELCKKGCC